MGENSNFFFFCSHLSKGEDIVNSTMSHDVYCVLIHCRHSVFTVFSRLGMLWWNYFTSSSYFPLYNSFSSLFFLPQSCFSMLIYSWMQIKSKKKNWNVDKKAQPWQRKLILFEETCNAFVQFAEHFISYYRNIFRIDGRGYLQFEIAILKH